MNIHFLKIKLLQTDQFAGLLVIAISAFIFGASYVTQYLLMIQPCELCLMERWVFGLVMCLTGTALISPGHTFKGILLLIVAVALLGETSICIAHFYAEKNLLPFHIVCGSTDFADVFARITSPLPSEETGACIQKQKIFGFNVSSTNAVLSFLLSLLSLHGGLLQLEKGDTRNQPAFRNSL